MSVDFFLGHKRPRSVHTPDLVELRDMKLQSHHLVVVGGDAYMGYHAWLPQLGDGFKASYLGVSPYLVNA